MATTQKAYTLQINDMPSRNIGAMNSGRILSYWLTYVLTVRIFLALILWILIVLPARAEEPCVILLHGLGRSADAMSKIENRLLEDDFKVWNKSYPSTKLGVGNLAQSAIQPGIDYCKGLSNTSFVTHSLGGILVRTYLQDKPYSGRIVMLSPPNKGSEIPDVMQEIELYKTMLGPAGQELGTDANSYPNTLKPIEGEIGIIAGDRSLDPWFSWLIPGPDDGKVSVESTRLTEMKDFLLVNHGHTFIMRSDLVIKQIRHFLQTGMFER
ncbi:MAG: hypothetical protein KTR18_06675 [Acidiferrobacterales bacterium]|nr:hypothetical protein [Acidiferrobacterales bacterium]